MYKFMLIDIDIIFVIYFVSWFQFVKVLLFYVLKDCVGFGYYVVFKFEGGDLLLWRLLFFIIELKILQNVILVQGVCYMVFKIIKG